VKNEGVQNQTVEHGLFSHGLGVYLRPLLQGYVADLPVFMFLIEGPDGEQIIVDSGFNPENTSGKFIFNPVPRTPDLEVPAVLAQNGVDLSGGSPAGQGFLPAGACVLR
jgi:hypothetical protein